METPNPHSVISAWSRARGLVGTIVPWGLWLVLSAGLFLYVRHYSRNIPFADEFAIVPMAAGVEPVTLEWAWAQHNEHRMLIPRLIMAGLFRFVSTDFRAGRYVNAAVLSAMAAGMLLAARKVRGCARLNDAALPLAMLNIAQGESVLNGFVMPLILTAAVATALIAAVARARAASDGRAIAFPLGISLVLLPLCGGAGMAMLPPLTLWLAGYVGWGCWSGRRPAAWIRAVGMGLLLAGCTVAALYLRGYARPVHHPLPPSAQAFATAALEYLSLAVYPDLWGHSKLAAAVLVLLVTATLLLLAAASYRAPAERPRALALMAIILATICVAATVGFSRAGFGPGAVRASRYISLGMPLFCALYIAWLAYGNTVTRAAVPAVLLVLILLAFPESYRYGHWHGSYVHNSVRRVERSLMAREAESVVLDRMCPAIHPNRESARIYLGILEKARMGPFAARRRGGVAAAPERVGPVRR